MNEDILVAKIKELEVQLAILKAQVKRLRETSPTKSFADLRGILKGKVESSEEDIDAVKYRFRWEDNEER